MGQMKKARAVGIYNDAGWRINQRQFSVGDDMGEYNRYIKRLKANKTRYQEAETVARLPQKISAKHSH